MVKVDIVYDDFPGELPPWALVQLTDHVMNWLLKMRDEGKITEEKFRGEYEAALKQKAGYEEEALRRKEYKSKN